MRIEGSYRLAAGRETVWTALQSPEVLPSCIPGCTRYEAVGEDSYEVEAKVRIAAISGSFSGTIAVTDKARPESYRIVIQGRGAGTSVRGEGVLSFSEEEGGETEVTVAGDVYLTGIVARVGQRLLGSTSRMMMDQFFACISEQLDGAEPSS